MNNHQGTVNGACATLVAREVNCTITYFADTIVLQGQNQVIHAHADKILKRFAFSPKPYRIEVDRGDEVVLKTRY